MPIYNMVRRSSRFVPPTWAGGTDEEIVEALEKHYAGEIDLTEYWSVGNERVISLSAMSATGVGESHVAQDATFVIMNIGGKTLADGTTECAFIVGQKDSLKEAGYMNRSNTNSGGWKDSARRTWCNNVYKAAIPSSIRGIFKDFTNKSGTGGGSSSGTENTTDTFALPAEIEVFGSNTYSVSGEGSQFTYYATASNRIKKLNGSANIWWERSPRSSGYNHFCSVPSDGSVNTLYASGTYGIAPFGVI